MTCGNTGENAWANRSKESWLAKISDTRVAGICARRFAEKVSLLEFEIRSRNLSEPCLPKKNCNHQSTLMAATCT